MAQHRRVPIPRGLSCLFRPYVASIAQEAVSRKHLREAIIYAVFATFETGSFEVRWASRGLGRVARGATQKGHSLASRETLHEECV